MDLKDYINKNLPNLNWNILPQIFEENNVELTEEIVEYLKTTPWNTNWSILNELGGNSSTTSLILDTTAEFTSMKRWALLSYYDYNILEGVDSITAETITVTFDGTTVELPRTIQDESSYISYGEDEEMAPSFSNYPVYVSFSIVEGHQGISIFTQSVGMHSIKIVINQPGISPVITN